MGARWIGRRLILVFLLPICVVCSQVSAAVAEDWDGTSHDWDQMAEADGNSDVKVSADEKWGGQAAPVVSAPCNLTSNNVDERGPFVEFC